MRFFILPSAFLVLLLQSCFSPSAKTEDSKSQMPTAKQQDCIEQIFAADNTLGKIRNDACKDISLSQAITNYADGLAQLDFTECPKPFENAFRKHREAWLEMIPITDKFPDLRGEMHDLFDKIEANKNPEKFQQKLKNIWDTWAEVEKAAE